MENKIIVKCENCGGYHINPSKEYIKLVNEGMTCNCGGKLMFKEVQ